MIWQHGGRPTQCGPLPTLAPSLVAIIIEASFHEIWYMQLLLLLLTRLNQMAPDSST